MTMSISSLSISVFAFAVITVTIFALHASIAILFAWKKIVRHWKLWDALIMHSGRDNTHIFLKQICKMHFFFPSRYLQSLQWFLISKARSSNLLQNRVLDFNPITNKILGKTLVDLHIKLKWVRQNITSSEFIKLEVKVAKTVFRFKYEKTYHSLLFHNLHNEYVLFHIYNNDNYNKSLWRYKPCL